MQSSTAILHIFPPSSRLFSGPAIGFSHVAGVQQDPVTPSFSLVPPVSSPCSSANGGIDLLAIGSSGCLTSRLPRTSQTREGQLIELPVVKGF